MSHSLSKIWIHAIWATKDRVNLIKPDFEQKLHGFIKEELMTLDCPVSIINGMPDHVHCLFRLNPQKSLADVMKQVKGSTSHRVNQEGFLVQKFAWQTGYAGFSTSESVIGKTFNYIQNQKAHHAKVSFKEEYEKLLKLHGLE